MCLVPPFILTKNTNTACAGATGCPLQVIVEEPSFCSGSPVTFSFDRAQGEGVSPRFRCARHSCESSWNSQIWGFAKDKRDHRTMEAETYVHTSRSLFALSASPPPSRALLFFLCLPAVLLVAGSSRGEECWCCWCWCWCPAAPTPPPSGVLHRFFLSRGGVGLPSRHLRRAFPTDLRRGPCRASKMGGGRCESWGPCSDTGGSSEMGAFSLNTS